MSETKLLILIYESSIIFMMLIQLILPNLSRRGLMLGVSIPEDHQDDPEFKREIVSYRKMVILLGLLFAVILFGVVYLFPKRFSLHTIALIVLILLLYYPLYHYHNRLRNLKESKKIVDEVKTVTVDINLSKNKLSMASAGLYLYTIPFIMIVLGIAYNVIEYENYPDLIPMHYDSRGIADGFSTKSVFNVAMPMLFIIFMILTMFVANIGILMGKQKLDSEHPEDSLRRFLKSRRIWTYYFVGISVILIITLGYPMIYMARFNITEAGYFLPFTLIVSLFIIIVTLIISFKVGTVGERLVSSKSRRPVSEESDEYWKVGGLIYYNPNDPAVFVAKRIGIGYSINLATMAGKLIIFSILLMVFIPIIYFTLNP